MKRILEVNWIDKEIVRVKLEATKRRKIWVKVDKTNLDISCTPQNCQLYYNCRKMKSPLKKYNTFGDFCNHLFLDYPDLKTRLEKFGVRDINQVVPTKKRR